MFINNDKGTTDENIKDIELELEQIRGGSERDYLFPCFTKKINDLLVNRITEEELIKKEIDEKKEKANINNIINIFEVERGKMYTENEKISKTYLSPIIISTISPNRHLTSE